MRLLLDTHLLLWVVSQSRRLSQQARQLIGDPEAELLFSVASLWEVAQSMVEGVTLLTTDPLVAQYPAPVRKI